MEISFNKLNNKDVYDICYEYIDNCGKLVYDNPPCNIKINHNSKLCEDCKYLIKEENNHINILKCNYSFKDLELDKSFILDIKRNSSGKISYLKYQKDNNLYEIKRFNDNYIFNDLLTLWKDKYEYMVCFNIYSKIIYKIKNDPNQMLKKYHTIYGFLKKEDLNVFSHFSSKITRYNNKEWIIIAFKSIK